MGGTTPLRSANAFVSNLLIPGLRNEILRWHSRKSTVNAIGMYSDHIQSTEGSAPPDGGIDGEGRPESLGRDVAIILISLRRDSVTKPRMSPSRQVPFTSVLPGLSVTATAGTHSIQESEIHEPFRPAKYSIVVPFLNAQLGAGAAATDGRKVRIEEKRLQYRPAKFEIRTERVNKLLQGDTTAVIAQVRLDCGVCTFDEVLD